MTLTKNRMRRQPTAAQRRQNGMHHKRSQHYLKAYWPYLPVFAVLLLGIAGNFAIERSSHDVLGYATNISSDVLLADTNAARSSDHKTALELNPQLTSAAQAKANDMAKRGYWSHVAPDGRQPWSFVTASGYHYIAAGENLAYGFGSSDQVVSAWMRSTEHRANILSPDYRDVGFATANVPAYQGHGPETIVVAMYGEPTNLNSLAAATTPTIPTTSVELTRAQVITSATWLQLAMAAASGAAIALFFARHTFAWHKVLVRGERFALKHPFFDAFLIGLAVLVFLLSHIAGTIL